MKQPGRRQLLLLGLLAVALIIGFRVGRTDAPAGTSGAASNGTARPGRTSPGEAVADLRLEALKAEHEELEPPQRNLFRFRPKAPPRPPPGAAPRRSEVEAPPVPPVPAGPPPPPPIPLKFIGVLDTPSSAARVAILSDARGNVFHGREGDIIDGRYKVLRIGVESAELSYVDGRGRQTIRLSGQ